MIVRTDTSRRSASSAAGSCPYVCSSNMIEISRSDLMAPESPELYDRGCHIRRGGCGHREPLRKETPVTATDTKQIAEGYAQAGTSGDVETPLTFLADDVV